MAALRDPAGVIAEAARVLGVGAAPGLQADADNVYKANSRAISTKLIPNP